MAHRANVRRDVSEALASTRKHSPGRLKEEDDATFIGLAFATAVAIVFGWAALHAGDFQTVKPIGWGGCVMTLFPIDGLPEPKVPGDMVEFTVPDLNGRPWADLWVKYFEQNMQRPAEQNDALAGFS